MNQIRYFVCGLLLLYASTNSRAQSFTFSSGPIPMCDTSYFTANVSGIGFLEPAGSWGWGHYLSSICMNITSNHPQTLVISITNPGGTTLLLSAYNGAGGSNYTNTCFQDWNSPITSGAAPFTGSWSAQGGSLSVFDWQNADGTWTFTVIDTACQSGGTGPGGPWVDGWFGGAGSATMAFGQNSPPPCWNWVPTETALICPAETFDLTSIYNDPNLTYNFTYVTAWQPVADPTAISAPGVYNVDAYDWWSGCYYNASFTLYTPGNFLSDQVLNTCKTSPINLTYYYPGLSNYTSSWSYNGTPLTTSAAGAAINPGIYQLIVSTSTGCSDTGVITLNDVSFSLGSDQVVNSCLNPYDLTQLYNTTGLVPGWYLNSYFVSAPSAVTASGIYNLVAQNSNGCKDTARVTLTITPATFLGADQNIVLCAASYDLTSLYNTAGLTASWFLNGNPVGNPAAVTTNGTYELIASDANGCIDTATVILNLAPGTFLGADQNIVLCATSYDLTSLYNTTGLTANWFLNGNPVGNPAAVTTNGTYYLIASDVGGCVDTASVTLNISPAPVLGSDQLHDLCSNATFDLTSIYNTTGLTTSWTVNSNPVINPAAVNTSGNYTLIATSAGGCSDTADITLNINAAPVLGADQTKNICSNTALDLTTLYNTSGYTSTWTLNSAAVATPSSVNGNGNYILIAVNPNGCADTAQVSLNINAAPALGIDQAQSICSNATLDLTSLFNTSGYTSTWTLNSAAVVSPSSISTGGNYSLIVTDASGCADTAEVVLNVNAAPVLGADQSQNICSNTTLDLTSLYNTAGYASTWILNSSAIANPSTINNGGSYILIATTANACSDTAEVAVTVNTAPALGTDQSQNICSNSTLDLTSFYNTSGYTSSWTLNGAAVATPTSVNSAGNYTVVATSANNCTDTATIILNTLTAPSLGIDQTVGICSNSSADLTSLYSTSGYTVEWSFNGNIIADPSSVNLPGSYLIVVSDNNNCIDAAQVILNTMTIPTLGADQSESICSNSTLDLTTLFNTSGYTTNWTFNNVPVADPSTINSDGAYTITATNASGCTALANAYITVISVPALGTDLTVNLCSGNSADLTGLFTLNGLNTVWTSSLNTVNDPSAIDAAGNYQLIAVDVNGCSDTAAITVNENPLPELGDDQSYSICQWRNVDLSSIYNTNGFSVDYTLNSAPVSNYTSVHDAGSYQVIITDANGCMDQASVVINNMQCLCEADFNYTAKCVQEPVSLQLIADSALIDAKWIFNNSSPVQHGINPTVKFSTTENMMVTLEAELSCGTVTIQKNIELEDCAQPCSFYFPSAFTPNSDGRNDDFTWFGECDVEDFSMEIRNRFGQVMFTSNNPHNGWNGKYRDALPPAGVYVYHVEYKLPYQNKQLLSGVVTLMR